LSLRPLVVACFALLACSPASAQQQPLDAAPQAPQFLSRYDFQLSAAALANSDDRFSWDTHFGGDVDVVDYVRGRLSSYMDYQAVLGNELRPFDPVQGNYILELSMSYRLPQAEVAAMFHHVSRHMSDRPKLFPIAWNVLGIRVLRRATIRNTTVDVVADLGGMTQRAHVDYRWAGNVDVVGRRQLSPRFGVFARGVMHLKGVSDERRRPTQVGGLVETGIGMIGEAGVGELFFGFENRFDAHPLDFEARRWFMVGFRALRR
jgi:hypothetical protein